MEGVQRIGYMYILSVIRLRSVRGRQFVRARKHRVLNRDGLVVILSGQIMWMRRDLLQ